MPKIKESTVYLNFLKSSWWLFLMLPMMGGYLGWQYGMSQPVIMLTETQLEVTYNPADITTKALIADEVVGVIRSNSIQSELGIDRQSRVVAHKNGPLLVNLVVENSDLNLSRQDMAKLTDFVIQRYDVKSLAMGSDNELQTFNVSLISAAGVIIGFFAALIVSLLKVYLRNY